MLTAKGDSFNKEWLAAAYSAEQHLPVIDAPDTVKRGDIVKVKVRINRTEHDIRWISVYFQPRGEHNLQQLGRFEFMPRGEESGDTGEGAACTRLEGVMRFRVEKSGTIFVSSYCNVHGLWENFRDITMLE